jgi:RNA polymerase sigma-70 factor, ECF subfamily
VTRDELASLYTQYGFFLRRRCLAILRDAAAAEDALQDVFVKVMHSDEALALIEQPLHWLYRIAHRVCLDLIRRRKMRKTETFEANEREVDARAVHPSVSLEEREWALKFLETLEPEAQEIALCAFVEGMNQSEIADELGYSRVTINKRITALKEQAHRERALHAGDLSP